VGLVARNAKSFLVAGDARKENVIGALELIKEEVRAQGKILIKPNLSALKNAEANTRIEAVEGVIDFLNGHFSGVQITIGESSGSAFLSGMPTKRVLEYFGYYGLKKKYGNVKVIDFEEWRDLTSISVKWSMGTVK
jgi:hypothetical protein